MDGGSAKFRQIRVLGIQDRHDFVYNSPRVSRHAIDRRRYLPLDRVYPPLAGASLINPWPLKGPDLVHSWKRIPLGPSPFIVGFGWHLPLTWEHSPRSFALLMDTLLSSKCRGVVASSQAAANATLHRHEKHPGYLELQAKTSVRLPNTCIPDAPDSADPAARLEPLRLVFVGDHFGRKGGCVAVKLAERALAAGLPLHITIVSSLICGGGVWSDPTRAGFFDPYLKLLELPNVTLIRSLPEGMLFDLLSASHMMLLPTLGDTLDYTAIESMARHTPVMTTATGAFPEFIDADSGILLQTETNCQGEWKHLGRPDRGTPAFEQEFIGAVDRLTEQAFAACAGLVNNPERLRLLRQGARRMAKAKFDAGDAANFWDDLYGEALNGR